MKNTKRTMVRLVTYGGMLIALRFMAGQDFPGAVLSAAVFAWIVDGMWL